MVMGQRQSEVRSLLQNIYLNEKQHRDRQDKFCTDEI
jgi:hypothetical protein